MSADEGIIAAFGPKLLLKKLARVKKLHVPHKCLRSYGGLDASAVLRLSAGTNLCMHTCVYASKYACMCVCIQ